MDKYFDIYDNFKLQYPSMEKKVVDWWPSGRYEITLKFEDGSRIIFDSFNKTFRNVKRIDMDDITGDEWCIEFGRRLKQRLSDAGLTIDELAYRTGLSRFSISKYINAKAAPSAYNLFVIARELGCSMAYLADFD